MNEWVSDSSDDIMEGLHSRRIINKKILKIAISSLPETKRVSIMKT
jgi:hypothetical protein